MKNHFEGATPEALARALLRPKRKPAEKRIPRKYRWRRPGSARKQEWGASEVRP